MWLAFVLSSVIKGVLFKKMPGSIEWFRLKVKVRWYGWDSDIPLARYKTDIGRKSMLLESEP